MRKFKAVLTHKDQEVSPTIHFTAKSLTAAKSHATRELVADDGTWQEWIQPNQWKKVVIVLEPINTDGPTKCRVPIKNQVEGTSILLTEITSDMYYAPL